MAITIDGSANTLAGVAAGGINDNVVDNGTMADNAIDSAELVAGAVDLAHLSATGTASSSTFLRGDNSWAAAGKIKQVVSIRQTGQSANTSSSSYVALHTSPTITPSSSSNKILVLWSAWVYCDNNNAAVTRTDSMYQLTKNHSSISETVLWQTFFGNSFTENSGMDWIKYSNQSITFVDEPSTTEEITYTINGRVGETGTSLYIADGSSSRAWTLIELAP